MGTPEFAALSLSALINAKRDVAGVFTQPDRVSGRGMKLKFSPVKELALQYEIPVFQPVKMREGTALRLLNELKPDLVVVVAYGRILPPEFLEAPPLGCINVHGSLLPELRGAAPIQWAVARGYQKTGVTTMYMAQGIDTGDIILYNELPIVADDTAGSLYGKLGVLGAGLLVDTIDRIEKGTAPRIPQDDSLATFAPVITKEDGCIDFTRPLREVDCHIRGMHPWPCAYFGDVKVHRAQPLNTKSDLPPGSVLESDCIVCGDGGVLKLLELQGAGGRRMNALDYLRGHLLPDRV